MAAPSIMLESSALLPQWRYKMPRPRLKSTSEQRTLVKSLAACGTRQEEIEATNRHPLRDDAAEAFSGLDRGAPEANYNMAQPLYNKAKSGDTEAAKFG